MARNKNERENKKINKIAESLAAVHTQYCLLVKNKNVNNVVNINDKDRTMLLLNSMGLSLCAFWRELTASKISMWPFNFSTSLYQNGKSEKNI